MLATCQALPSLTPWNPVESGTFYTNTEMKKVKLNMILHWVVFFPIILPLCMVFGAVQGALQMAERVINQFLSDVTPTVK